MKTNATVKRCGERTGFTLVEVVVTMALLSLFMAGAYVLIVQTAELSRSARNSYIAAMLCRNRLERARNFDYVDLPLLEENQLVVDDNGAPSADGFFRRTTTVDPTYVPPTPILGYDGGLTELTVLVEVRNKKTGSFGPMKEELTMLFTEYLQPLP